jgi:hypothetical protein
VADQSDDPADPLSIRRLRRYTERVCDTCVNYESSDLKKAIVEINDMAVCLHCANRILFAYITQEYSRHDA